MTEFEFSSLHFDDEQMIKEIRDLKYESENRDEGGKDEDPQPLLVYTASTLFPTFIERLWSVDLKSTPTPLKTESKGDLYSTG